MTNGASDRSLHFLFSYCGGARLMTETPRSTETNDLTRTGKAEATPSLQPASTTQQASGETLELWREQDEALQRIWGVLGVDGDPGSPADIAAAVERYMDPAFSETICVECGRTVDEGKAADARLTQTEGSQASGSATEETIEQQLRADLARVTEERDKLQRVLEIERAFWDRVMPCPDCRDKVKAGDCERCKRQRAQADLTRVTEALRSLSEWAGKERDDWQERNADRYWQMNRVVSEIAKVDAVLSRQSSAETAPDMGISAIPPETAPSESLRVVLSRLLDNLYGLHYRPGHLDAILDVVHLYAPVKVPVSSPSPLSGTGSSRRENPYRPVECVICHKSKTIPTGTVCAQCITSHHDGGDGVPNP